MTDPSQTNAHARAEDVLAAAQPPSQSDQAELQRVANNLDRLLAASAVGVDGLIDEFELARNLRWQSMG